MATKKIFYSLKKMNIQRHHSREMAQLRWMHDSLDSKIHKWILFSYLNFSHFKNTLTFLYEVPIVLMPPGSLAALRLVLFSHTNCSSVLRHQIPDHPKTRLAGNPILSIHDSLTHYATFLFCHQLCQHCHKIL